MNIHEEGEKYPLYPEQRDIRKDPVFRTAVHNFGLDPDTVRLAENAAAKATGAFEARIGAEAPAKTIRETVLDAAKQCVVNDRQQNYGTPKNNFLIIAQYWNVYILSKYKIMPMLNTTDVAVMMSLMKHSRLATSPDHRDNWIDIAGYAACGAECACKGQGIPE